MPNTTYTAFVLRILFNLQNATKNSPKTYLYGTMSDKFDVFPLLAPLKSAFLHSNHLEGRANRTNITSKQMAWCREN